MQYIKERELELNNLKKENYILIEENRKLKNEIEKAKAFFEERDIIASRMKKIKEEKLEYFNLFLKFYLQFLFFILLLLMHYNY